MPTSFAQPHALPPTSRGIWKMSSKNAKRCSFALISPVHGFQCAMLWCPLVHHPRPAIPDRYADIQTNGRTSPSPATSRKPWVCTQTVGQTLLTVAALESIRKSLVLGTDSCFVTTFIPLCGVGPCLTALISCINMPVFGRYSARSTSNPSSCDPNLCIEDNMALFLHLPLPFLSLSVLLVFVAYAVQNAPPQLVPTLQPVM